ncbi:MAG: hypothetical protein R6U43_03010 [Candidatus Krumholzibacteriales bacterium]
MKKILFSIITAVAVLMIMNQELSAQCGRENPHRGCPAAEKEVKVKPQSVCPVMGGKIDRQHYVDVKGRRVYACCEGCLEEIRKDPDKYMARIRANGETAGYAPVIICGECGEEKDSERCCAEDAARCSDCGLIKGSPGCCNMPRPGRDARICSECGKFEGSDECCVKGSDSGFAG